MPLIPALGRQISVSLRSAWSIRASFRTAGTTQRNPVSKKTPNKTNQTNNNKQTKRNPLCLMIILVHNQHFWLEMR